MNKPVWMRLAVLVVGATLASACGGGDDAADESPSEATETSVESGDSGSDTTLPAGATAGQDDYNQDGEPEPTCGTRDFKAGLVLRILCDDMGWATTPPEGVTLVEGSLFGLPGIPDDIKEATLTNVSADAIRARDVDGQRVYVFFHSADTLFAVGSSALSDPAKETLGNLAGNIDRQWPAASVQVRGHTDSTGSASANQRLSEERAREVAAYLGGHGIDGGRVTSVGLGATLPIVVESSDAGRELNRRVEIVVRVA